jgi:nucleotide-binding universal stress UspA family protein
MRIAPVVGGQHYSAVMEATGILIVIEPHAPTQRCLGRALMMARYLHARLDILLCPKHPSRPGNPVQARQRLEEEWQYVAALRQSIVAPDVQIGIDIAGGGRLCEVVVERVRQKDYALVIKAPWHREPGRRDPNDWQLMRRCPAPLLLTAGNPWQPQAHFLAVLDASTPVPAQRAVLEAANALRVACAAQLDLVCVEAPDADGDSPTPAQLEDLARQCDVDASHLHRLQAQAADPLRQFVADRSYDLVVIGVPPAGHTVPLAQALASADCDLLTIHAASAQPPVLSGRRRLRWNRFPLWQWLGAD